jgi:hypothetical protein
MADEMVNEAGRWPRLQVLHDEVLALAVDVGQMSPTLTEVRLLAGDRVGGIKLDDVEPESVPEVEERYTRDLPKTTFKNIWGGHGYTIGGVPIDRQ